MVVTKQAKRSDPRAQFASIAWSVTLTPEDLGLPSPPYTPEQAIRIVETLSYQAQLLVNSNMVRDGVMTPQEFEAMLAPFIPQQVTNDSGGRRDSGSEGQR